MKTDRVLATAVLMLGHWACSNDGSRESSSVGLGGVGSGQGGAAQAGAAQAGSAQPGSGSTSSGGRTAAGAASSGGRTAAGAASTGGRTGALGGRSGIGGASGGSVGGGGTGGGTTQGKWVGGYYPGYQRAELPPDEIDFTAITHLVVGAGLPQPDGSLDMALYLGSSAEGIALAKQLVSLAHGAGRKALLMLGGAGADSGFVAAASEAHRAALVTHLLEAADTCGFDGFDLDWEPIRPEDEGPLLALARALRSARPSLILTIPAGYVNANSPTVSSFWGQIAPLVDQVNLMTYSMTGAWDGWQSWHSSALTGEGPTTPTSVQSSVENTLKAGVPAAKLGIGIGFYGACYTAPVTAPHQALGGATVVVDDNQLSYAGIMADYFSAAARHYDAQASAPYLSFSAPHGAVGCTYLTYEDAESIAAKGAYVKQKGLGGTIIWTINEGHLANAPAGARDPLLTAVRDAFLR